MVEMVQFTISMIETIATSAQIIIDAFIRLQFNVVKSFDNKSTRRKVKFKKNTVTNFATAFLLQLSFIEKRGFKVPYRRLLFDKYILRNLNIGFNRFGFEQCVLIVRWGAYRATDLLRQTPRQSFRVVMIQNQNLQ